MFAMLTNTVYVCMAVLYFTAGGIGTRIIGTASGVVGDIEAPMLVLDRLEAHGLVAVHLEAPVPVAGLLGVPVQVWNGVKVGTVDAAVVTSQGQKERVNRKESMLGGFNCE